MAVTFVGGTNTIDADTVGAASVTVTLPTHTTNDILIVAALNDGGTTMTTATSGWASIVGIDSTDNARWFWKRAASGAETSPVIESTSSDVFCTAWCLRGCITTGNPWDVFDTANALATAAAEVTAPTITTTGTDRLVCIFAVINDDTAWTTAPPLSGWTLPTNGDITTASGTDARMVAVYQTQAAAGDNTANSVGTISTTETWATLKIAFIPAAVTTSLQDVICGGFIPVPR